MTRTSSIALLSTLVLLGTGAVARAEDPPAKPGSVAYPDNPAGTPQAGRDGAPVVTDKAACQIGTRCPDKPAASTTAAEAAPKGATASTTAYPRNPDGTPAAQADGTAPKR